MAVLLNSYLLSISKEKPTAIRTLPEVIILSVNKYQTICNKDIIDVYGNQIKQQILL